MSVKALAAQFKAPKKEEVPCVLYHFRHSAEGEHGVDKDIMEEWCNKWGTYWVFQIERGLASEESKLHYQGTIHIEKKVRVTQLKNEMRKDDGFLPQYLEPMVAEDAKHIRGLHNLLQTYAGKTLTRVAGPWSNARAQAHYKPVQFRNKTFVAWQDQVCRIIAHEQATINTRTVHWVFDWWGNHGKTVLMNVMALEGKALILPTVNNHKDLTQACCDMCMDGNITHPNAVFIDIPRAFPQNELQGFTSAMESIKDGRVVEMRNHFRQWWMDTPSIWMFSNVKPPTGAFSADRLMTWMFTGPGRDATLTRYITGSELIVREDYIPYDRDAAQDALAQLSLSG